MADIPVVDWEVVQGNVGQTLQNLVALRAEIMAQPRPNYSVHGEAYSWVGLYKFLSDEITVCMKQLSQLSPFEIVSVGR